MTRSKKGTKVYARCFVTRNGVRKEVFSGRWGEAETEAAYHRICAEFYSGVLDEDVPCEEGVSLAELFDRYLEHAEKKVRGPEIFTIRRIIGIVYGIYPEIPAKEFTARTYRTIQDWLVRLAPKPPAGADGSRVKSWTRQYVNLMMKKLRAIFKWGVSYDFVPPEVLQKISTVPPVAEGEFEELPDSEPRDAVADRHVLETLTYLPPMISDMIKIQRGASMRPGEVCGLRVGDLDRRGEFWSVTKKKHKTSRHGVKRFFAFNREETEILRRRCVNKGADQYVFSPREAQQERWAEMRATRKSKVQPSQVLRAENAEAEKLLRYREKYDSHAYNRAVFYAIAKARKAGKAIPRWTPYQLRHAAVTDNSLRYGREDAGLIAGHKSLKTTEIYDHKAPTVSLRAAKERGAWWEEK